MIIVSACLLGENCKYNGGNNYCQKVVDYIADKDYVAVCPELMGGLTCPRSPVERVGDKAINKDGEDVSAEFLWGAGEVLSLCRMYEVDEAILKEGSPSCGVHRIYDGTFSGTRIPGMGYTTEILVHNGINCKSEDDI